LCGQQTQPVLVLANLYIVIVHSVMLGSEAS
jgi:hypothetical protein